MDPAKGGLTRSTAVRRALDQLVQELAVSKVREEVHPILKARVVDIGIPKHLVKKVRAVVYEKAERLTRKGVHQQLREAAQLLFWPRMPLVDAVPLLAIPIRPA